MPENRYDVAFLESSECAPGYATFRFEKPAGYDFVPGQYFSLTLSTRDGEQTERFTQSDAPRDPWMELTTRMTGSAFKDALAALRQGDHVEVRGPLGTLTLPHGETRLAFLAGGVGVTPARSIIRDTVQRRSSLVVTLFYGNQVESCIPFRDEFDAYASENPDIDIVYVMAEPGPGWKGERGFITAELVRRRVDPSEGWFWMSSGPPAMLKAMRKVLDELGIPHERTKIESFGGYE